MYLDDTEDSIYSVTGLCDSGTKYFSSHLKVVFFAEIIKISVHCKKGRGKAHRDIWLLSVWGEVKQQMHEY